MSKNVRVLANAESITSYNQASEQKDNFLPFTKANFKKLQADNANLKAENLQLKKEIIEVGREIVREFKKDPFMWII